MKPNYFMNCVTDIERAVAFYNDLFEMQPAMSSPDFVSYDLGGSIIFAVWSSRADDVKANPVRLSEIGLSVESNDKVDEFWTTWQAKGAVIEPIHDAPFGRTFVIADPDGNHIRVAPAD